LELHRNFACTANSLLNTTLGVYNTPKRRILHCLIIPLNNFNVNM